MNDAESASSMRQQRLRIAIQKSGRLAEGSLDLLKRCGIDLETRTKDRLLTRCVDFPVDIMHVRDDDIPAYVSDGVCDLGIVGLNTLEESNLDTKKSILRRLGFGRCELALAVPKARAFLNLEELHHKKIATSYPKVLRRYLSEHGVEASVVELAGSVEIAPALGIADAICDLVSTGITLASNGLRKVLTILDSEAVLVGSVQRLNDCQGGILKVLLRRMDGVMTASHSKYVMMHAPESALEKIRSIMPGLENPTILPLAGGKVAIHAVAREQVFWETMESLKDVGASSILIVPIEKMIL